MRLPYITLQRTGGSRSSPLWPLSALVNQQGVLMKVGIFEAKAKLSKLVAPAERGCETVTTRDGKADARLVQGQRSGSNRNAAVITRIERFSRTLKMRCPVDLRALLVEGRL